MELPDADCEVLKVYDAKGRPFSFTKSGPFVEIIDEDGPRRNEILELLIRESVAKRLEAAALEKRGGGFYRVPGAYRSLVYRYYPTYRVAKNIPTLRASEDQRIPRKAILKHFAA